MTDEGETDKNDKIAFYQRVAFSFVWLSKNNQNTWINSLTYWSITGDKLRLSNIKTNKHLSRKVHSILKVRLKSRNHVTLLREIRSPTTFWAGVFIAIPRLQSSKTMFASAVWWRVFSFLLQQIFFLTEIINCQFASLKMIYAIPISFY